VDATIAKSVQRVMGSVIGAVYAFLVMLSLAVLLVLPTQAVRLQVDATIAKSIQRVTGSLIGAVYAFLVMLWPDVLLALLLLRLYACRWMPP